MKTIHTLSYWSVQFDITCIHIISTCGEEFVAASYEIIKNDKNITANRTLALEKSLHRQISKFTAIIKDVKKCV